uniref:Nonribisomal peptide synthetase malG n=1 Tax=Malbranchea aurantiaca TaxID=78605 RepID=MALG_MALAU|nr:RecName: Full=Nonribisomal peptide synthase malG; Short=NRPS malG; AltName: Full=Malbrancheamide biosynthesis cluster protein G [Malbranchea aurantiaca]AGA37267.1 NRPS [Malbranchea aurantiaca]
MSDDPLLSSPTEAICLNHSVTDLRLAAALKLSWTFLLAHYSGSSEIPLDIRLEYRYIDGSETNFEPFDATFEVDKKSLIEDSIGMIQNMLTPSTRPHSLSNGINSSQSDKHVPEAQVSFTFSSGSRPVLEKGATTRYAATVLELECLQGLKKEYLCRINFNRMMWNVEEATGILRQFRHIAQQIVSADVCATLSQINLMCESDIEQLKRWNSTVPDPVLACIHELFSEQAKKNPTATAVQTSEGSFDYGRLDELSSALACHLSSNGLTRGTPVPLLFDKSMWMVVATLAVLKAGATCVSICTGLPTKAIEDILEQTAAQLVLVSESQGLRLSETRTQVVSDKTMQIWHTMSGKPELPQSDPTDLACIIFTSGSTGKPKGIMLDHIALVTSIRNHGPSLGISSSSRALQFSSYAFDMSFYETYTTLLSGGCICIPSETERLNSLPQFICDHNVNWAFLTPSVLRDFHPSEFPSLRTLATGGEPVGADIANEWAGRLQLFNLWGPAEATICATGPILPGVWIPGTFGKAVGCIAWITQAENPDELVPIGAVGEVLIEGPVLAQGYSGDVEKTKASFIPFPKWRERFELTPRGRVLFRTGDLAQYNPDGTIRYVGRMGTVVKVGGQRVDIDAVEYALRRIDRSSHIAVEAVELEKETGQGPTLIAFLSSDMNGVSGSEKKRCCSIDPGSRSWEAWANIAIRLQDTLAGVLPRYMIPHLFIPVSTIPTTPSGKANKRQLQALVLGQSKAHLLQLCRQRSPDASYPEQHLTENETLLRLLVSDVLGIDRDHVAMNSRFFHLGGDSLAAVKLVALARQQGIQLKVEAILQSCSLREAAGTMISAGEKQKLQSKTSFAINKCDDKLGLLEEATVQCGISESDIEEIYPSTPLQEGLITVTSTFSASKPYVDKILFTLSATADLDRVRDAWNHVVAANDILRSRIILSPAGKAFNVVVRSEPSWQYYKTVQQYLENDNAQDMTFGKELITFNLIASHDQSASARSIGITIHHALYDNWTVSLLHKQAEDAYRGELVEPCSFSTFSHYVLQQSPDINKEFWRKQFLDLRAGTFPELPSSDYVPRANSSSQHLYKGQHQRRDFSMATNIQLAWALLLSLYTNSPDVVYGLVVNGRMAPMPGVGGLVGPTIATVPFRTTVERSMSVQAALEAIQKRVLSIVPFEQTGLQNIARMGEGPKTACNFQNLLVIQQDLEFKGEGIFCRRQNLVGAVNNFPGYGIILLCSATEHGWAFEILYSNSLIPETRARRILLQLDHLLRQLEVDPYRQLAQLELLCPSDKSKLTSWNTQLPIRVNACIPEVFGAQCLVRSERTAVSAWDGSLSYRELDRFSSIVARHLQAVGVGKGTITPILFEKSRWVVVAMLAVLKTGAAFVMLDTNQPLQRKQGICRAVRATTIATSASCAHESKVLANSIYVLDEASITKTDTNQFLPLVEVSPNDLAYVVFTSGSTGEPKGVLIEHASSCSASRAQAAKLGISPDSRVLQLSSYTFDSFAVEILASLLAGCCICIPSESESSNDIAGAVRRFSATWLCITPSVLGLTNPDEVPSLKTVVAVGESARPSQIRLWSTRVNFICGYGPSECSTGASAQLIRSAGSDPRIIGSGMGSCLWVAHTDDHNVLVPIGAIGELLIQGPIVGRGYMNSPEKTRAAFLESTAWIPEFRQVATERFYKTGDLVRQNEDGSIVYLGRKNREVKLRGQRLDLEEVENQLSAALEMDINIVAEVVKPKGVDSQPVLIAFFQVVADVELRSDNITFLELNPDIGLRLLDAEEKLRKILPPVMIPSVYLQVQRMPLTMSGKMNRQALRNKASTRTLSQLFSSGSVRHEDDYLTLQPHESTALFVCQAICGIMRDKIDDTKTLIAGKNVNLSRTGMDSIDAMMLARTISRHFGITLSIRAFLGSSVTVRDIARLIEGVKSEDNLSQFDLYAKYESIWEELRGVVRGLTPSDKPQLCDKTPAGMSVFLTGGTGFLGTHILRQILQDPRVELVTVLTRAESPAHALSKIVESAKIAQWWQESYRNRIDAWVGDLARPRLGLSDDHWARLCGYGEHKFTSIIHNGAAVHWGYDFEKLKPVNVMSTFWLLVSLFIAGPLVNFTYVSALLPECDGLTDREIALKTSDDGYSQTKYVSELLVKNFKEQLCNNPIAIVRPGLLIGSAEHGVANVGDYLWRVVSSAFSVGAYISEKGDAWIYIAAVDWVANQVIREALYESTTDLRIINVTDGLTVKEFWRAIQIASPRQLNALQSEDWLSLIRQQLDVTGKSHPLWPVISFLESSKGCLGFSHNLPPQAHSLSSMIITALIKNVRYLASLGLVSWTTTGSNCDHSVQQRIFRRVL